MLEHRRRNRGAGRLKPPPNFEGEEAEPPTFNVVIPASA